MNALPALRPGPDSVSLWRNARLATMSGDQPWGLIDRGAIAVQGERIAWVGPESQLPAAWREGCSSDTDLQGALLTPGLIDCHTHLVYGGQRAHEFELRLQGASYEDIALAGGGIRATVKATREASDDDLWTRARQRALCLMAEGVTTLEIKSGYGLSAFDEARCLQVARRLGQELPLQVRTTYLGAHALPPEYQNRPDDYIQAVCDWLPELQAQGLVDAVDAFCDNIGFTRAQTQKLFEAAKTAGLPVKLHAEQLSDQDGASLAAQFRALSCDHLEHLSKRGVQAMAAAGTVAVLLPGAYYFLRETHLPPVQQLRDAGVPIAIASDHNPGSCPALSLLLMLNVACTLFRLTPEEALRGVTVQAAKALGLADHCGSLEVGKRADFAIWSVDHPHELSYWFGHSPCKQVVYGGQTRPRHD